MGPTELHYLCARLYAVGRELEAEKVIAAFGVPQIPNAGDGEETHEWRRLPPGPAAELGRILADLLGAEA